MSTRYAFISPRCSICIRDIRIKETGGSSWDGGDDERREVRRGERYGVERWEERSEIEKWARSWLLENLYIDARLERIMILRDFHRRLTDGQ